MCDHHTLLSGAQPALTLSPIDFTAREYQFADKFSDQDFPWLLLRSVVIEPDEVPPKRFKCLREYFTKSFLFLLFGHAGIRTEYGLKLSEAGLVLQGLCCLR